MQNINKHLKTQEVRTKTIEEEPNSMEFVPTLLKTQEMCAEAIQKEPYSLHYVRDKYKYQEIIKESMLISLVLFFLITDHLKIREMCIKAVVEKLWDLFYAPDYFKTQKIGRQYMKTFTFHNMSLIALWQKSKQKYGMRTLIHMMMSLLHGIMAMNNPKNERKW